jgi:DNA-binding HxlR family transcriptional regulator
MENHTMNDQAVKKSRVVRSDDFTEDSCPVTRAVRVIGGKWKLFIIYHLMNDTRRFGELQRLLPGITQQMLTTQLRELEADGLVHRKVFAQVPPKVEYSLTPVGKALEAVTRHLAEWGDQIPQRSRTNATEG